MPRLKLKWAFALSGGGQPTVVGDWLFITNRDGKLYALDARTGCIHWMNAQVSSRTTPMIVRSPISASGWVTFVGVSGTVLAAFDAQSGKPIWRSPRLDAHPFALLTGTPVVWGERVYAPVSSFEEVGAARPAYACCSFRGSLVALDLRSGKPLWQTFMIEEPLGPSRRNSAGTQMQGPAGAAIWSAPTIDAKRGVVYVATGDSYTDVATSGADAIVAIDLVTGKVRWKTQVTVADNYTVACDISGPDADGQTRPLGAGSGDGTDIVADAGAGGRVPLSRRPLAGLPARRVLPRSIRRAFGYARRGVLRDSRRVVPSP